MNGSRPALHAPLPVAFFIRALEGGGATRDAILLANALAERGQQVGVLTLGAAGPLRTLVSTRTNVIELAASKLRTATLRLAQALARLRPRVLVSAEAAPNVITVLATRLLPTRLRPKVVLREASSPSPARALPSNRANHWGYLAAPHVYARLTSSLL